MRLHSDSLAYLPVAPTSTAYRVCMVETDRNGQTDGRAISYWRDNDLYDELTTCRSVQHQIHSQHHQVRQNLTISTRLYNSWTTTIETRYLAEEGCVTDVYPVEAATRQIAPTQQMPTSAWGRHDLLKIR